LRNYKEVSVTVVISAKQNMIGHNVRRGARDQLLVMLSRRRSSWRVLNRAVPCLTWVLTGSFKLQCEECTTGINRGRGEKTSEE
jgi:hypothetical protein